MSELQQSEHEAGLTSSNFLDADEPFALFGQWFEAAQASEPSDPNAMALATSDASGLPDVRMVLMKDFDERGWVFYTNAESTKGQELAQNMQAAAVFHWKSLKRQVRIRGPVEEVSAQEADEYFSSRPRGSRIGAWASAQSRPLESRFALEKAVAQMTARYGIGPIPRPSWWRGYRIMPVVIEFWQDRPFRLHDRLQFHRPAPETPWHILKLYP